MKALKFILTMCLLFVCNITQAQLYGDFYRLNDGNVYYVLVNPTNIAIPVTWIVSNSYLGQQKNGSFYMQPRQVAYYGPSTIGWTWQNGEVFSWQTPNGPNSISFRGNPSRTGHCKDCGLNKNGKYICASFSPQNNHDATCECTHNIKSHSYR